MKKIMYLLAILTLAGCSGEKFSSFANNDFSAAPQTLELVGNDVNVTVEGTFPGSYFPKDGILTITPTFVTSGGNIEGEGVTFYGQDVPNPGLLVVPYNQGGTFAETQTFEYVPEMRKSELYVIFNAQQDGNNVVIKRIKIADGVITTSQLVDASEAQPMMSREQLSGRTSSTEMGTIQYEILKSKIRQAQLAQSDMIALVNTLKELQKNPQDPKVSIQIFSTASPDGSVAINQRLSKQRNAAALNYMRKEMKKYGLSIPIKTTVLDEDWEGLYQSILKTNLANKQEMVQKLSAEKNENKRCRLLQKYINANPVIFKTELLPPLRKSVITVNTETPEKTNSWLLTMMHTNVNKLSLNDRLVGTTLLPTRQQQIDSYKSITQKYPKDWRAYNNLGALYIEERKWDEASNYLNQSLKVQNTPEANFNLGLVSLEQDNAANAENYFANLPVSPDWREAQGTVAIMIGDYPAAVAFFGDIKSNNAGLAQILNEEYPKAINTLDAVPNPNDTTYYLKAIVGARTENSNMVYNNLNEVKVLDQPFAETAWSDVEFSRYWNSCQFSGVLK